MERACGTRVNNGLYLSIPLSSYGKPIEHFLVDPTKICDLKPFRTPIIVEGDKYNDIIVYIGKEYYPFVSDFVEECRIQGISRRIPKNFPFEKLTPYESRMFLVHERAVPLFPYDTGRDCPRKKKHLNKKGDTCVFDLWHLSALESIGDEHVTSELDGDHVGVLTPSVKYSVNVPRTPPINPNKSYKYHIGIFACFWISHLEYVNKQKKMPETLLKRVKATEFDVMVMDK